MSLRTLSLSLACVLTATVAQAAPPNLKPGLWEMEMEGSRGNQRTDSAQMQAAMEQMRAKLAQMPPEQRRMIEQQMGQMGFSPSQKGLGMRVCMTADDIKREQIPLNEKGCDSKVVTRSASRWVADITCRDPQMTGTAEAVFDSATAYRVSMKGQVTEEGRTLPFSMKMQWKYVGSDCGSVKPLSALQPPAPPARR